MADWQGRVDQLLFAGEDVVARVGGGRDEVVVTTHRVLAFTPARDGPNFQAVDRPNVREISFEAAGRTGFVVQGLKALVVGALLVVGGLVVDLGGVFGGVTVESAGAVGAGGLLEMLTAVRTVMALANEAMLAVGGLLVLAALGAFGAYWYTRSTDLVVAVAGDDDLRLHGAGFSDGDVTTIRTALGRS
ncbi:MAG: hypothetical protein ABEJ67_06190 [Halanaeroarchaeum sp.]